MSDAADYFWVGGTGEWSDLSHWATTSGGAVLHSALPTSGDDVFFDGASFQNATDVVTIGTDATFRNLRITTRPNVTFTGPVNVTMNCHGLILIDSDVQYNFDGTLRLVGNGPAQTISALGIKVARHVIFDNPNGQWIAGPFEADSLVQFVSGNLIVVNDIQTKFVEFKANSPSLLTLQQDIFLTGSDFIHNGILIPVALIDLTNINFALAGKGFMHFFGKESTFKAIPAGQVISLDGIVFGNPRGSAYIEVVGLGSLNSAFTNVSPDGYFKGNFDTDILELGNVGSGMTYTWESGEIFDIGTLSAFGISCVQLTNFRSSIDGQESFLRLQNLALIDGGELIGVRDLHVLDGMIQLINSFDQGNIDGWIIEEEELFAEERLSLCPDQNIYLKPDKPVEGWIYEWSDNSSLDSLDVLNPGIYSLDVTDTEGCTNSDTIEVDLFDPGTFSIGNDTTICEGDFLEISVDVDADSYSWSNGDMDPATTLSTGLHTVEVMLNGCEVKDTIIILAKPLPIIDLGPDLMNCQGEPLNLESTLSGVDFIWSDGSTSSSFDTDIEGTYWVDVSLNGCTVRDSIDFSYRELPSVSLGRDSILCEGDVLQYNFDNPDLSFLWNDDVVDSNRAISTAGEYSLEVSDGQCIFRDTVIIGLAPRPVFDLGRDTMLCTGESLTLSANPTLDETIQWVDGSNRLSFDITSSGTYWLDVNKLGCRIRDEIVVIYNDPPEFDLGMDTLICEQAPLVLRPRIGGASYTWQDGSEEEQYTVDRPGSYSVAITKDGCTTMDQIDVDTRVCTFYRAYLPEAFSPNADGVNDIYKAEFSPDIEILNFEMTIYDRWGSQLFLSEDPLIGWDGTFYQKPLNSGTYLYTIEIDYIDDRGPGSKSQRGEFIILR